MNQRTQKPIDWSQVPEFRSNDPKLYELDPVLLDDDPDALMPDYMSRLGTSAAEASKAFQGLQEASKDLVDLEIVIPAGHQTDPAPIPARPGYMDISEPVDLEIVVHGSGEGLREVVAAEAQKVQDATLQQKLGGPRIQTITMAESVSRLTPEVHREMLRAMQEPAPAPWHKRLWSWFLGTPEPLTDEQMEEAVEGLEHVLRLPWYKRLPAFIAWT